MSLLLKPFRWLFSLITGALVVILLLVVLAMATAGLYMPWVLEKFVDYRTGFPMTIKDSRFQLFTADVGLWDVLLQNPDRFPERGFIDLKALSVKASPLAALGGKIDIDEFIFDLSEITWVKNAKGESNLSAFLESFEEQPAQKPAVKKGAKPAEGGTQEASEPVPFSAKKIIIRIGKVVMVDYSGSQPTTKVFTLNYSREFDNVTSLDQLIVPLTADFTKLGVQFLTQSLAQAFVNSANYQQLAEKILPGAGAVFQNTESAVSTGAKGLFDAIKNIGQ
ncbi:MAG: hypothetical protein B7X06_01250 [Verrucomicrobia bacterium 21-51-4]|nr:MAG: hypothetical protein B7X06_01250 [Verrucomicrobia bacterium 21-51-4]HQU08845.1 hypothetical protein [Opitutales bacterium]